MFYETMLTKSWIGEMSASGEWTDEHLFDRFRAKAVAQGNAPLVIDRHGQLSWADAARVVDDLSRGFLEIGIRPADAVQIQLPNRREFMLCVLALERIGAVANPVAPIFRSNEVGVMSALAKPVAVVTVESFRNFDLVGMHLDLRESCPWVQNVIVVPSELDAADDGPADTMSWSDLIATGQNSALTDHALDLVKPSPNDVCEIIFTSGTTGQPKGVMHTQNTLNAATDRWLERIAPDCSVFHMASTLAHQTGYLYGLRTAISVGGRVVYQEVWDPVEFAELIETHGIEASMGATPFLADLMAVEGLEGRDLSTFKAFVCAGATIPLPVLEQARDALPCTVMPGWGMTEMGLATSGRRDDPFEKLATDGIHMTSSEVRVVDEVGQPVPAGEEGDLQYRGSLTFVGYAQGRELTESCWRDGWFDSGDRAVMDSEGYISISGRTKDIVIRGGENIPVKEVEDVLIRHSSVANCAIVGKPHNRLGEISCAVVLPIGDPPTLEELTQFLEEQKVTRQFWPEALRVIDEFPMTPSGKIQKYKLRDLVTDDA